MTIIADLIVRMQPYSKGLKSQIFNDSEFSKALKINNPSRFVSAGAVVISSSPLCPQDKIIGFFVYDIKKEIFKQDFIVDVNGEDREFVLYTRNRKNERKNIKDIKMFFKKYGQGVYYLNSHHPTYEDIPDEIKPSALRAIRLAKKLKITGLRVLSESEIDQFDKDLTSMGL